MSWAWMMAYSEDQVALAAEYALGTLDSEERIAVETIMVSDEEFTEIVRSWEYRLGALNQMVGPVEPRPEVWNRIKLEIGLAEQQALAFSEPEPSQAALVAASEVKPAPDGEKHVPPSKAERRWRNLATFAGGLAAMLLAILAVTLYRPDLLLEIRPKPRIEQVEVVKLEPAPALIPAPQVLASAQYVAILQANNNAPPAFILTVDGATRNFTVRKLGAEPEAGKSFELWLISDKLPQARSLGVIGPGEFTSRPVLASYDEELVNTATYAVTVEDAGGSDNGNPHSVPVFTGKLIETVPPAPKLPRG
jgi:anti-sigma-K factor RskA